MSERFGSLPWQQLFDRAIELAENGFVLDERTAFFIGRAFPTFPAQAQAFYGKNGESLKAGDLLVQSDLANSLRLIAAKGAAVIQTASWRRRSTQPCAQQAAFCGYRICRKARANAGSRIMPEGTGVWLNNSLAYCTFEPKGNPMDAHAGRHKLSGDCPTIILRDGKPWVAIGAPGGQTVPQMAMNLIDFGMNIQQAIAAPRISFIEPDIMAVEERIPASTRDTLAAMGHHIQSVRGLGNAHGLAIAYDANGKPVRFTGGADPRGQGRAMGY